VPASAEPATRPEPAIRPLDRARLLAEAGERRAPRAEPRAPAGEAAPPSAAHARARAPEPQVHARGPREDEPLTRHADFTTWQPPEEEGDDEPILSEPEHGARAGRTGAAGRAGASGKTGVGSRTGTSGKTGAASERGPSPAPELAGAPPPRAAAGPPAAAAAGEASGDADAAEEAESDEFVEVYVNVGRRDGARAADFQRLLVDRAEVGKDDVGRIRVRERNAFVSVRKTELARAVEALDGATIAGKEAHAELARSRAPGDDDASSTTDAT
jgi:ATP-dependent RNA helicase DeaD